MNPNPWDSLKPKPLSPDDQDAIARRLGEPIIEPPWVDIGNAAYGYGWSVTEEDQKLLELLSRRVCSGLPVSPNLAGYRE